MSENKINFLDNAIDCPVCKRRPTVSINGKHEALGCMHGIEGIGFIGYGSVEAWNNQEKRNG